ncbi:mRNA 3'-end-processing protein rna14 [Chytriomyces hyalinus]|nr:mRNA 3'-end-processing protein rna14 [Chytriomyces hyalinus]
MSEWVSVLDAAPATQAPAPDTDKLQQLKAQTQIDKWNASVWRAYVDEGMKRADDSGDSNGARQAIEEFVAVFPSVTRIWVEFIAFETRMRAYDKLEALFTRCLRAVVAVPVWEKYLDYIKSVHSNAPIDRKEEARKTILKAFELVLSNVGLDRESGHIWLDYLKYIKSLDGLNSFELQQMMDLQRKVFHKALSIPLTNIEAIWKEYDAFENGLNKLTAKKLLSERSALYMTARTAYREMKIITAVIDAAAKTWMPTPTTWSETDQEVLRAWKKYISWEQTNPLRLEDSSIVSARVMYAYKSALLMMRFFPELWYDAARYLIDLGKLDEAAALLQQAVEALPRSLLLSFALAELEESRKREFPEISKVFDNLLINLESWVVEVNQKYDAERDTLMALLRGGNDAAASSAVAAGNSAEWDGERREEEREKEKERNLEIEAKVEVARKRKIGKVKQAWSLVWVVYMRVARRSENVKAARNLFKQAKKSDLCTYHVYVASALMEYYSSKDVGIACRIFEAGMKVFAEDNASPEFVLEYLSFLIQMNDENNARALFERALTVLQPDQARDIWSKFLSHEVNHGELANVLKLESRMKEAFSKDVDTPIAVRSMADRWAFLDIDFIGQEELGLSGHSVIGRSSKMGGAAAARPGNIDLSSFSRPTNLDPVHSENIVTPELNKWTAYKPEAPEKVPPEKVLPFIPPSEVHKELQMKQKQPMLQSQPQILPQQQQQAKEQEPPSSAPTTMLVAECIAQLLDRLPPASSYNGPLLPLSEILDGLRRLPLPTPVGQSRMVPISLADKLNVNPGHLGATVFIQERGSHYADDQGGSFRGRGRGRGRFGVAPVSKRKGGYGSDEDQRFRKR